MKSPEIVRPSVVSHQFIELAVKLSAFLIVTILSEAFTSSIIISYFQALPRPPKNSAKSCLLSNLVSVFADEVHRRHIPSWLFLKHLYSSGTRHADPAQSITPSALIKATATQNPMSSSYRYVWKTWKQRGVTEDRWTTVSGNAKKRKRTFFLS